MTLFTPHGVPTERDPIPRILVIDDDKYLLSAIGQTIALNQFEAELFSSSSVAIDTLGKGGYDAVVTDIRMPVIDGMQLLERVMAMDQELPVIMITGHGDIALAVEAMKKGAYDFLQKPVDDEVLLTAVRRAVQKRRLILDNRRLHTQLQEQARQSYYRGMIGCHPLMNRLYDIIEMVGREGDPVLISGETGTGKELVARAIHDISARGEHFVGVNMAAMPGEINESELFGHERGAFTGAIKDAVGKFEHAGRGTLFLDEICSMNLALQAKLLRVLEERQFTRIGSNKPRPLQARIISATNRDLLAEVAAGTFREDLYYRLNGLQIEIPPLRERKEDIPLLVEYFRKEYCRERNRQVAIFSREQLEKLQGQPWPGNIRELRNAVRRLCVFGEAGQDLQATTRPTEQPIPLQEYMEQHEQRYLVQILKEYKGRVAPASRALGLSRKGLYDKIHRYGIDLDGLK